MLHHPFCNSLSAFSPYLWQPSRGRQARPTATLASQLTVYFRARENEKSRCPSPTCLTIPGAHMDGYVDAVCPVYSVTIHDSAAAGPAAKWNAVKPCFHQAVKFCTGPIWDFSNQNNRLPLMVETAFSKPLIISCGARDSSKCCLWWLLPNTTLCRLTLHTFYGCCPHLAEETVSSQHCCLVCILTIKLTPGSFGFPRSF